MATVKAQAEEAEELWIAEELVAAVAARCKAVLVTAKQWWRRQRWSKPSGCQKSRRGRWRVSGWHVTAVQCGGSTAR